MILRLIVPIAIAVLLIGATAQAQFRSHGKMGASNKKGIPIVLTPCGALQLDFTVATGCNAVAIPFIVR